MNQSLLKNPKASLAIMLVLCVGNVAFSQIREDPNVPDDLKAVIGVNIDIDALSRNPLIKSLMETIPEEGGPPFKISDLTKISALVAAPKGIDPESLEAINYYVYLGFKDSAAVAQAKAQTIENGGQEVTIGGKSYVRPDEFDFPPGTLMEFLTRSIVIGTEPYITSPSKQLATKGLATAYGKAPKHPVRIVVDMDGEREMMDQLHAMANDSADFMTKPYVSLLKEVSSVTITSDISNSTLLRLELTGHDEKEAGSIKKKLDALLGLAKGGIGMIPPNDPTADLAKNSLEDLTVELSGNSATIDLKKPEGFDQAMAEAIKAARAAAVRTQDMNNFRQVSFGVMNYHDVNRGFPFEKHVAGEDAKSGLSWKVSILPYIEQNNLFDKFDMDSGFESAQNAPLAKTVVPVYQLTTGGQISWVRASKVPKNFASITDGTSNTICFVQNRAAGMSPWTQPTSITPKAVVAQVQALKDGESMIFARYDGSIGTLTNKTPIKDVEAMLEPADGKAPNFPSDPFDGAQPEVDGGDDPFGKGGDDPFGKGGDDPFGKGGDDPFGK